MSFGIPRVKIRSNSSYISPTKKEGREAVRDPSVQIAARFSESELERSKLNARYYKGLVRRASDHTVVIVAPVCDDAVRNYNQETETLYATMDFPDEEEDYI